MDQDELRLEALKAAISYANGCGDSRTVLAIAKSFYELLLQLPASTAAAPQEDIPRKCQEAVSE